MSLKSKEFLKMREEAMAAKKERYEKNQNQQVDTIAEIAAKLKTTSMVKGNFSIY